MLDLNLIRKNPDFVKEKIRVRKFDPGLVDQLLEADQKTNQFLTRIEELRHEKNVGSKGKPSEKDRALLKHRKGTIKTLEMGLEQYLKERDKILLSLPNIPRDDLKVGLSEKDNEIIKTVGGKTKFTFKPKGYLTLAEKLDLIDMVQAGKVSGTRFGYLKGKIVRLQYALFDYAQRLLIKNGFIPMVPPLMIKQEVMRGLGYIEGIEEQEKYHLEKDQLYLVATAEHSLIPYHMNQVLKADQLPLRYFAYTPAFRREAGSYGQETKGIMRVHQFDKIEMVSFCLPDNSDKEQYYLLSLAEELMKGLGLPYHVLRMCTGDLVFPSARTLDLETWLPGQNIYKETHSCSNITDFQARRLNIKFRGREDKTQFVHTLNSTVFAMGRILIAIMENYQTKEGAIKIPKVLQKYCGLKEIN